VCKVKEIAVVGDFVRGLLADDSGWIGLRNLGSRVDYVKVSSEESGDGKVHVVIPGEGEGPAKQSGDADSCNYKGVTKRKSSLQRLYERASENKDIF